MILDFINNEFVIYLILGYMAGFLAMFIRDAGR